MIRNLEDMGPTLQKIVSRLLSNQNLLKFLYYTDKDPLNHQDFTEVEIASEITDKLIKIIPRVGPKETATSLISLRVTRGRENFENSEFNNISLAIEVFVPLTQWYIKNKNLRPFCIMGEILKTLNNKEIDQIGKLKGGDFDLNFLTEEISCYEMTFSFLNYD